MTHSELANLLKAKFQAGDLRDYEIVIALIAMVKDNTINLKSIQPVLEEIHNNNYPDIVTSLEKAMKIIDDRLIDDVLEGVRNEVRGKDSGSPG
ncbi:hypothetical protein DCCM_0377 [Desulfocucumis palustris]|uniref:Uncharacterized protein n=1 Tax=Desulfocucumis palustris TaxID=1898651 RepID=A0A2L2XD78_9FIRM|nr:hypothetical protein [Desulfocucumis palustris]GBF32186.1 hypothetical protein DCCM_0377 [Desulfocucumis palustris]